MTNLKIARQKYIVQVRFKDAEQWHDINEGRFALLANAEERKAEVVKKFPTHDFKIVIR